MEAIRNSNELSSIRITKMALDALQEATEAYIVGLFEDAQVFSCLFLSYLCS